MTNEEWRAVVGYEGFYEVSSLGRVRSQDMEVAGPYGSVRRVRGRVLALATWDGTDYSFVSLGQKARKVHQLVMAAFVGPPPQGLVVCHNNGEGRDNRLGNLRYDTRGSNLDDAVRHGTHAMAGRTHCPQGHEYNAENTRLYRGRRYCRACHSARARARRAA